MTIENAPHAKETVPRRTPGHSRSVYPWVLGVLLGAAVREESERQLQQAVLQDGILRIAADNASSTISGMLKGFGFLEVDIR